MFSRNEWARGWMPQKRWGFLYGVKHCCWANNPNNNKRCSLVMLWRSVGSWELLSSLWNNRHCRWKSIWRDWRRNRVRGRVTFSHVRWLASSRLCVCSRLVFSVLSFHFCPSTDKDPTCPPQKHEQCKLTVFLLLLSPDTHTHSARYNYDRVIVISAAQVEKCLFKVRTAHVREDNDTQESPECGFCASLKAPLCACWVVCVPCELQCVSASIGHVFLIVCFCIRVCACLVFVPASESACTERGSRESGVCLVSRQSGNPEARITAGGSSVLLRGPQRLKFSSGEERWGKDWSG